MDINISISNVRQPDKTNPKYYLFDYILTIDGRKIAEGLPVSLQFFSSQIYSHLIWAFTFILQY
jgi:hypothetical protein